MLKSLAVLLRSTTIAPVAVRVQLATSAEMLWLNTKGTISMISLWILPYYWWIWWVWPDKWFDIHFVNDYCGGCGKEVRKGASGERTWLDIRADVTSYIISSTWQSANRSQRNLNLWGALTDSKWILVIRSHANSALLTLWWSSKFYLCRSPRSCNGVKL